MFVYYINVPINEKGVEELDTYDEEMKNVKTFELSSEEYEVLRKPDGLFQKFDNAFGTIIDICEEERINNENLDLAIQFASELRRKRCSDVLKNGLDKILESLTLAAEVGLFWEIDIYLE